MVSQLPLVVGGKGEKGVVHAVSHPAVSTISAHSNPAEESPVTALQVSQNYLRIDTEVSTLWFLHCKNLLQVKEDSVMTFRLLEQNCLNSMYIFKEIVSVSVFKRYSVKAMPQLEIMRIKNFV